MLKRLTLILMAFCLILGLAACGNSAPDHQGESRPENWDAEAEVLRYCNGFYRAKTAEELKPYVLSETADARIKEVVDELNASLSGLVDTLDYRDYPYDSVEVTLLDTYKGYEILWVKTASSAFQAAADALSKNTNGLLSYTNIGSNLLMALTIENGHYVSSLDEAFFGEVLEKYDYCQSCHGEGGAAYLGWECPICNDAGTIIAYYCQDCHAVNVAEEVLGVYYDDIAGIWLDINDVPCGYPTLPMDPTGSQCCECGGSNQTTTQVTCHRCLGSGGQKATFEACTTCNGNGWIKK